MCHEVYYPSRPSGYFQNYFQWFGPRAQAPVATGAKLEITSSVRTSSPDVAPA